MPLVKTTENTDNQNPIELEIKPVKQKRQMSQAQLDNLKKAREIKALKRQQSLEQQTPTVIKENPINNQESKAVK